MRRLHKRKSKTFFLLCFSLLWAESTYSAGTEIEHCAVLKAFEGDVEILDSNRSDLLNLNPHSSIPCGSWISVRDGWVQMTHASGYELAFSSQTFAQIQKGDLEKKDSNGLILFVGEAYIAAEKNSKKKEKEFRAMTPSARARIQNGKAILIFDQEGDHTQLIALQKAASLENKFEPSRKVKVQTGESTELNLSVPRVIPSLPKSVSVAALRVRLNQLHIPEEIRNTVVQAALKRKDRALASIPISNSQISLNAQGSHSYERIPASPMDSKLKKEFVTKITGGDSDGETIPNSQKDKSGRRFKGFEVTDWTEEPQKKHQPQDDAEKKRLMDELSRIEIE